MSTDAGDPDNENDNVSPPSDRGWSRSRDTDSEGHRLVRLKRCSDAAEEGVFTCHIPGDDNTPRYLGVYYLCELY